MELNQYQYDAMKTRLPSANASYVTLGLIGEVGELYGMTAKAIRDKKELDFDLVKKEIGDILWFVAATAADYGFTLQDVAEVNLAKLQKHQSRGTLTGSGDNR